VGFFVALVLVSPIYSQGLIRFKLASYCNNFRQGL